MKKLLIVSISINILLFILCVALGLCVYIMYNNVNTNNFRETPPKGYTAAKDFFNNQLLDALENNDQQTLDAIKKSMIFDKKFKKLLDGKDGTLENLLTIYLVSHSFSV